MSDTLTIGFTGTQQGMTYRQKEEVRMYLFRAAAWSGGRYKCIFRHGDCIGADEQAARIARELGYYVIAHPPLNPKKRSLHLSAGRWVLGCDANDEELEPKPYLDRNRDVVDHSNYMIACPKESDEQLRSGTWTTWRYSTVRGVHITLITP